MTTKSATSAFHPALQVALRDWVQRESGEAEARDLLTQATDVNALRGIKHNVGDKYAPNNDAVQAAIEQRIQELGG